MNDTENFKNHMQMDLKQNPRREISSSEQLQPIKTQKKDQMYQFPFELQIIIQTKRSKT